VSLAEEILAMIEAGEVTASRIEILEDSAAIILDNAREKITGAGVTDVKSEYVLGDPATRMGEYAERNGAELIVIGHRGLGPHSGLLGGVAGKLVNMTNVSVLIAT
jgi:nucleotide-binding universal stress UspA family protein